MGTDDRRVFVISWTQVEIDGDRGAPASALRAGAQVRWTGRAERIDAQAGPLLLTSAMAAARTVGLAAGMTSGMSGGIGPEALQVRARRSATRLLHGSAPAARASGQAPGRDHGSTPVGLRQAARRGAAHTGPAAMTRVQNSAGVPDDDHPDNDRGTGPLVVTDGRHRFCLRLVPDGADQARLFGRSPGLVVFEGEPPPADTDLWVVGQFGRVPGGSDARTAVRTDAFGQGIECFTQGTLIATPDGPQAIETLAEGSLVLTRDNGAQPVVWIGRRRLSGARLCADPRLRPVRIRAGAPGSGLVVGGLVAGGMFGAGPAQDDRSCSDLILSPGHRVLLRGPVAHTLFNTAEVLVAARDLIDDHTVCTDHSFRDVTYIQVMFDRHQVIRASGFEVESFHPGHADLEAFDHGTRMSILAAMPVLALDIACFGPAARRCLTQAETAFLRHGTESCA